LQVVVAVVAVLDQQAKVVVVQVAFWLLLLNYLILAFYIM
jgi:hypothetical protein